MAPPRKNISQAIAIALAFSKGKGKVVEVVEPASHYPNLSDIHIIEAEDSQFSSTSPQRVLTAASKARHRNEQLLQTLSSLQK